MSSDRGSLNIPGSGKKSRPKSPRRKAPSAPKKKKKAPQEKETPPLENGGEGPHKISKEGEPNAPSTEVKGEGAKSLRRSVSPRKEQYMSLLDEMVGQGDMVLLDPITEDGILSNLSKRYTAGEIYVSEIKIKANFRVLLKRIQCRHPWSLMRVQSRA